MESLAADISRILRGDESHDVYPDGLTAREVDVLRLIAIGRSNKDIGKVLAISLNTVATHVRNILTKTDCANRTEAAGYASRNELNKRS
jgi:DNA-binding NarL/FixJ family response regulator